MSRIPIVVTIAGSDSGGGAGVQADIKSMSANGVYAASVITALTAQNTLGVTAIHDVPADFITAQIEAVFSDLDVAAVKIGMLSQPPAIAAVAEGLKKWKPAHVVLDPVMVAASGDPLIAGEAVERLVRDLFPLVSLVTPNLHEAARLTGEPVAKTDREIMVQAEQILGQGASAVLVKGGHGEGQSSRDYLLSASVETWLEAPRIGTQNTHGTGCSLSSAIASHLALGRPLEEAVRRAKDWLTGAIRHSGELKIGQGHGPVHHFHELWEND